MYVIEII